MKETNTSAENCQVPWQEAPTEVATLRASFPSLSSTDQLEDIFYEGSCGWWGVRILQSLLLDSRAGLTEDPVGFTIELGTGDKLPTDEEEDCLPVDPESFKAVLTDVLEQAIRTYGQDVDFELHINRRLVDWDGDTLDISQVEQWQLEELVNALAPAAVDEGNDIAPTGKTIHPTQIADAVCKTETFARDEGDRPWVYHEGAYRGFGARRINARAKAVLKAWGRPKQWSSHKAREVQAYIVADAPFLDETPPLDTINLTNGLLDVSTRELRLHSPDFMSPVQLPVVYDPEADCPYWEQFMAEVLPSDAQDLPWELAALLMLPIVSVQKALLCLGSSCNGKSRFLEGLRSFVGRSNTTAISLHKLEGNAFAASRLVGKLANICPDLPSEHLRGTSVFKAITGDDLINAEYKYGRNFDFRCYARLFFSANHPPRSPDSSDAFFRRWLVVPFERSFEGREIPAPIIDAHLADPRELSGVLNKALDVLPDVLERGIIETESMREAWDELRTVTDPVAVWLNRATVSDPKAETPKNKLLSAYNDDCEKHGRPYLTKTPFGLALKRIRPDLHDGKRTVAGSRQMCWLGIGLKAEQEQLDGFNAGK